MARGKRITRQNLCHPVNQRRLADPMGPKNAIRTEQVSSDLSHRSYETKLHTQRARQARLLRFLFWGLASFTGGVCCVLSGHEDPPERSPHSGSLVYGTAFFVAPLAGPAGPVKASRSRGGGL